MFNLPKFTIKSRMRKIYRGYTHDLENKILYRLTPKVGKILNADQLTLIGFMGSIWMGVWISLSGLNLSFLAVSLFGWVLNWFGDGLDGKVAVFRKESRPRYGYYIDSMVDTFTMVIIIGSVYISGLTLTNIWVYVLVVVLMIAIHVYLKASVTRLFEMQIEQFGGFELKALVVVIFVTVILTGNPVIFLFGYKLLLLDFIGFIFFAAMVYILFRLLFGTLFGKSKIQG